MSTLAVVTILLLVVLWGLSFAWRAWRTGHIERTPLAVAQARATMAPARKPEFLNTFFETELLIPLESEDGGPVLHMRNGHAFVPVFDSEARFARFAPEGTPRLVLTGRQVATRFPDHGLALNVTDPTPYFFSRGELD